MNNEELTFRQMECIFSRKDTPDFTIMCLQRPEGLFEIIHQDQRVQFQHGMNFIKYIESLLKTGNSWTSLSIRPKACPQMTFKVGKGSLISNRRTNLRARKQVVSTVKSFFEMD